jgi:phytoene desaturase
MKKIIIIGAGMGGISAAALLAKQGHDVTVIEKNEQAGGRASVWTEKGYTFDMGPSWYLMRDVYQKFFAEFNQTDDDIYRVVRLDPSYRIFFGKHDYLDISANIDTNRLLFERIEKGAGHKFIQYITEADRQYQTAMKLFMYRSYNSLRDFFIPEMTKEKPPFYLFKSIDAYTKQYFKSEKLRKILQYTIVFLGGTPKNTPALYSIMAHIDFNLGVWYPQGGIYKIIEGIQKLAESHGAKFIFNEPIKKIDVVNNTVHKVIGGHNSYEADIVITNADYAFAETQFLERKYQSYPESYWQKKVIAPSAYILYLGVNKKLTNINHHNLLLQNDWIQHFDEIFKDPKWPENPSMYICCPSKTDTTVAPPGKENLFILVPVAAGLTDTEEIREAYYKKTLKAVEDLLQEKIEPYIEVKRIFAHNDFSERYNAYKGSALGLTHTLFQSALWRPHHKSKKVKNLYYTGQYTHPGIGLPMAIISSQIVAELIAKEHQN